MTVEESEPSAPSSEAPRGPGLEAITQQVMELLRSSPNHTVDIGEAVAQLGANRRRVLDVVNGLEAGGVINRVESSISLTEWYLDGYRRMEEDEKLEAALLAYMDEIAAATTNENLCIGAAELRALDNWDGPVYVVSGERDMVMTPRVDGTEQELMFSGRNLRVVRVSKEGNVVHVMYPEAATEETGEVVEEAKQGDEIEMGMEDDLQCLADWD